MFEIKYTVHANQEIEIIRFYFEYILLNYKASKNFYNGITETIQILKDFPYAGKIYLDNQNRYLIYKNFYIFYQIQENNKVIFIKRIIHKNKVIL